MKFHINSKGLPSACTATINKCPYGGAGSHYTKEDAHLVCKIQNELNHGLINSSRKNIKKAETNEELKYIEVRRNALLANGKEMNEATYVEKITSSIQIEGFSPNTVETYHFKIQRETRNEVIEDIGKGEIIGNFECEIKIKKSESKQIYRIYDSGYVEIYKQNDEDKQNETHTLVTGYIFKKNQLEAIFLNSGNIVSSEWLSDVSKNNKKMQKELKNKIEKKKQKDFEIEKEIDNTEEESMKTSEKNKVELTEEQQERKIKKNAKRRQRQRENARKRKSETFSKEQIENERSN